MNYFEKIIIILFIVQMTTVVGDAAAEIMNQGNSSTLNFENVDAYLERTKQLIELDLDSAKSRLVIVKKWIEISGNFRQEAKYNHISAICFWRAGVYEEALHSFHQSSDAFFKAGDEKGALKALSNIGALYNLLAQNDSAKTYLTRSLVLAETIEDSSLLPKILYDLGNLYNGLDDLPTALEYLLEASKYARQQDDTTNLIAIKNVIGTVYQKIGKTKTALSYYTEAKQLNMNYQKFDLLGQIYNNIGLLYWKNLQQLDSAKFYIMLSYNKWKQYRNKDAEYIALINLGGVAAENNELDLALYHYFEAKKLGVNIDKPLYSSALFVNIGNAYVRLQKYDSAKYYVNKGLALSIEAESNQNMRDAYYNLFVIDTANDMMSQALQNHILYKKYSDSVFQANENNRVIELTFNNAIQKKENLIRKLQSEKALQLIKTKGRRYLLIIGFILNVFIVLAFVIVLIQRNRKNKAFTFLVQKNKEMLKVEERLRISLKKSTTTTLTISDSPSKKYISSSLSDHHIEEIASTVLEIFDTEKIYLDNKLTLNILAEKLGVRRNYLSQTINIFFEQNFNELINSYRIKEAQKLLANEEYQTKTIEAIARSVGFSAMSSFISAFKKSTGVTPSYYAKKSVIQSKGNGEEMR
jgi:AraC-like DNA-binding protein